MMLYFFCVSYGKVFEVVTDIGDANRVTGNLGRTVDIIESQQVSQLVRV